uniref:Symplectin/biotinidase-like protein 1 n=1 Tax=Chiroteuthis calyx TaxID=559536 RepID=A0A2Z5EQ32_9MOLL|nr:symplectin/biotinidase-like protein 1 [Chiroteuthis calyx]
MESPFSLVGRNNIFAAFLLVFFPLAIAQSTLQATNNVPYRAAVYEHAVISAPPKVVSRTEAVANMMKNVRVYEEQTKIAAGKGAKIIVFPEDGILGLDLDRITVKSYLEEIPNPRFVNWNPSETPNVYNGTEIQRELSRIAKENHIYMVVNMGTKVTCTTKYDPSCPFDGQRQYNTNVVYSQNGMLVAVYKKRNLYIDLPFDPAPEPEYVTFDTPFGRFGTVICFDILFKEPTSVLLEKYKIRNLLYPTAMKNLKPFVNIIFESAVARAHSFNFLAANLHVVKRSMYGSGLYSPEGARAYVYNANPGESRLLIADMEAVNEEMPSTHSTIQPKIDPDSTINVTIIKGSVLGLQFLFRPLLGRQEVIKLCYGDFCCSLDYEIMHQTTERYALGVANGFIYIPGDNKLYVQACTLSKCYGENCLAEITSAKTIFERFNMAAHNFKTSKIYPSVVAMNESSYVLVDDEWTYNRMGEIHLDGPMSLPLYTAVLFGVSEHED